MNATPPDEAEERRVFRTPSLTAVAADARWQALLLSLLCLVTFASGLTGGFVLDDQRAIVGHPVVQGTAPLGDAFRLTFWGQPLGAEPPSWRPLATLSFALDHRLFGNAALAFHVSSLLWYVALVLVAWAFARRCMSSGAALTAMAFFALMPVHVETVSSLVGRADVLAALLGVLALRALSPAILEGRAPTVRRVGLAALAFTGGLLCKEDIAALPVIVALFVEYRRPRAPSPFPLPLSRLRAHLASLALFATLGVYLVVRLRLQPTTFAFTADDDVLVGASIWEKIAYGLELVTRYLRLVVAPTALCAGRKYAEVFRPEHVSLAMVLGAGLLAYGILVSWRAYRRQALPFVAAAFAAWLLVTGVFFAIPESMADRFLLLPSLFLCFSLGAPFLAFWKRGRGAQALLLTVLGAEAALSVRQARTWHDEGTLWVHAMRVCPDSVHDHFRYAEYLSRQGETAEAVWHYALVTKGMHAFPHAWSHPAREEERSMPADQRLREMHRLLQVGIDEKLWRSRFASYLRHQGRSREARLVAETAPAPP